MIISCQVFPAQACDDVEALSKLTDDWGNQTIRNSTHPGRALARSIMQRIDTRDKYRWVV